MQLSYREISRSSTNSVLNTQLKSHKHGRGEEREFRELTVVPQKAYPGEDTDRHGIRIDVYLDEKDGDIVDLEPDQNSGVEDIESLPRRVRFYHAKIDAGSLAGGTEETAVLHGAFQCGKC